MIRRVAGAAAGLGLVAFAVLLAPLALGGCDGGDIKLIGTDRASATCNAAPAAPPASLGLDPFYTKYLDATGIPVISSDRPADAALVQACLTVVHMLRERDDVRQEMIAQGMRVGVIGTSEVTTNLPEYNDLYAAFPGTDWDALRGVGATLARPVSSFGEENILCQAGDPYAGENVLIQTFSSSVLLGVEAVDATFDRRLQSAFTNATSSGLWQNTFASQNPIAYFGMGVQDWFDAWAVTSPSSGPQNQVNTRAELRSYDPGLAGLVGETMPDDAWRPHCP